MLGVVRVHQVPKALSPEGMKLTGDNWLPLLGKRRYYRDLCRVFRAEIGVAAEEGERALTAAAASLPPGQANAMKRAAPPLFGWVFRRHIMRLMAGAVGGCFHGLVSAVLATLNAANSTYGNPNLVADGLAYMAYTYDSLFPRRSLSLSPPLLSRRA